MLAHFCSVLSTQKHASPVAVFVIAGQRCRYVHLFFSFSRIVEASRKNPESELDKLEIRLHENEN